LSEALTSTLFHYGKFDVQSVVMTGRALIAYGVGLIGLILVKILAPGFYAKQDIKTPVKIGIGVLIATQLMNLVFVPWIAHAGLALSIGLGACVNAVFLYWGLRRRGIYSPQKGWGIFLLRLVGALFLLAGVALWTAGQFDWLGLQSAPAKRVAALMLVLLACAATYFGSLIAMGFRFGDFRRVAA
jgi:putative peptidoglycan lipid II flippase